MGDFDAIKTALACSAGPRPEPDRDGHGRYMIPPPGSKRPVPHTRVSTVAETLADPFGLFTWREKMVAQGIARRGDLYNLAVSLHPDDKSGWHKLTEAAKEAAGGNTSANNGTAMHAILERIQSGEELDLPPALAAEVDVILTTLDKAGIVTIPSLIERVVVLHGPQIAGTIDRGLSYDAELVIGDLKTGSSVDLSAGKIASQLACYARADSIFDVATKTLTPAPSFNLERALVIHAPFGQGRCELLWADIAAGWEAVEHALWARSWRRRKDLLTPFGA